jgi:hypothetical protein
MHVPATSDLLRSSLVSAALVALAGSLAGCGAATPGPTTPAHGEVEVVVPKAEAPPKGPQTRGDGKGDGDAETDEPAAAIGTLEDMDEKTLSKLLDGSGQSGVLGVLKGIDLSGNGSGIGGIGLGGGGGLGGGIGLGGVLGGGGSGVGLGGLGSIGTLGRGGGGSGISGYGVGGGYRSDPVSGTSIDVGARSVIELGDLATLGISSEQAARALRGQFQKLRLCYETKGLDVSATSAGTLLLRLVIGSDGYIKYAASGAPFLPSKAVVACVTASLIKVYVGPPPLGAFAAVETEIAFRPRK